VREIGINMTCDEGLRTVEYIQRAAAHGFNTLFTDLPDPKHAELIANTLASCGMRYETIHAPFSHINDIWLQGEGGDAMFAELMSTVDRCRQVEVPIAVIHLSSGKTPPPISDVGYGRYTRLVEHAAKQGVKIAFENQRKPEYLEWAFRIFRNAPHVGFCYDCGHEGCFTPGVQFMPLYGDKLLCTHVHDNDCLQDHDLHMLPFDGRIDFGRVARQIRESGYKGPLTLEIHAQNSGKYDFMTMQIFLERAAMAIKRFRSMVDF